MELLVDRFFKTGDGWIDLSSGREVRVRLTPANTEQDLGAIEECTRLSNLRHTMLNALIDHGSAPSGARFEAYEVGEGIRAPSSGALGEAALSHVIQFLRSSDLAMPPARARFAMRSVVAGRCDWQRPVGFTIQARRALESIEESLDRMVPVGPSAVNVTGANRAGLRTLRTLVARSARLRGFVPIAPAVLARYPALLAILRERHVCVLDEVGATGRSAAAVSQLIAALATSSSRRHVVVRFHRNQEMTGGVRLDPLGIRSLMGMVFAPDGTGPSEAELFEAARASEGLPGAFVARLAGAHSATTRHMVVHESTPVYEVAGPAALPDPSPAGGRVLGAALRAGDRAAGLARAGRHSVAVRLLDRGIRVLEGRERTSEAARCALQLGWLALDRGTTGRARTHFAHGQRLAGQSPVAIDAAIALGVAFVDENRLVEAEAILRGASLAAATVQNSSASAAAAAALGRCLLWQERYMEAAAVAGAHQDAICTQATRARVLAVIARAHAKLGRSVLAVKTAREAQHASSAAPAHVQASVELALAEVLGAAGDAEGARAALARVTRLARTHHLPLARVRALMVAATLGDGPAVRSLARLAPRTLPALLAHRLATAATPPPRRLEPVAELEILIDLSQRAADDGDAATQICRLVEQRLGASTVAIYGGDDRALAVHGRGWPSCPLVARQAIATGAALRPDSRREPQESAEPVRYGGEVIAALTCRWVAGSTIDLEGAIVLLRAAALSVAPHVRAMLDRTAPPPPGAWGDLLGESPAASALRESVARAARAPFPVLVEGESGCGKELVARAIHRLSPRRDRRFCALNCAALADDLVETELFGHVRGAFTGAAIERAGLFEEADGGTLFLDEVGELSGRAQAKLLRVLQEGEVRRVGENLPRRVDVRVVAATNRKLAEEVTAGRFRNDLRFRLDVVRIVVPPLRDRTSDIPLLAAHFWRDASERVGSRATLSNEALSALARYDWPGNVRELQNVIAWIAVQSPRRGRIGPSALPRHVAQATAATPCTFEAAREEFERRFVRAALAGANGQRTRAAEALGVTRQGLSKMMRRLRIDGV
jgi:DNA-binding NtrC family response regulator